MGGIKYLTRKYLISKIHEWVRNGILWVVDWDGAPVPCLQEIQEDLPPGYLAYKELDKKSYTSKVEELKCRFAQNRELKLGRQPIDGSRREHSEQVPVSNSQRIGGSVVESTSSR